jgi:predicted dehydrogenase
MPRNSAQAFDLLQPAGPSRSRRGLHGRGRERRQSSTPEARHPSVIQLAAGVDLPSAVLELANLYTAFARDRRDGKRNAPGFDDALRLHRFFDRMDESSSVARRIEVA